MDAEQDHTRSSTWSVGQLARASGLSVRVLRHWEDKGLVQADRSTRGHRRYGPDQVTRLYRALALRRTGLSLSQIAALLDEQDPDPAVTLRAHVEDLGEDLRRRGELLDRLAAVLASLEDGSPTQNTDDIGDRSDRSDREAHVLMRVIESMTMFEQLPRPGEPATQRPGRHAGRAAAQRHRLPAGGLGPRGRVRRRRADHHPGRTVPGRHTHLRRHLAGVARRGPPTSGSRRARRRQLPGSRRPRPTRQR